MDARTIDQLLSSFSPAGDGPAILDLSRDQVTTTTRTALFRQAGRLAAGLRNAGLEQGDRVAVIAPNSAEWIISALAALHAGAVVVPVDIQMPVDELAHVLTDCTPRFMLTTTAVRERIREPPAGCRVYRLDAGDDEADDWTQLLAAEPCSAAGAPDDPAALFYTSGTTGPPKGVPLTHGNLSSNVEALCSLELVDHADRIAVPLPFHHVYPFTVGILTPLTLGAPIVVPRSLVGPQILRALQQGEASVMLAVPRLLEALWAALEDRVSGHGRTASSVFHGLLRVSMLARQHLGWRLGRYLFAGVHRRLAPDLRLVVAGGAALSPDLGRRLQGLGWNVATGYGLSETSPILTFNPPRRPRLDSAGEPLPGVELAIDDGGSGSGRGEILARGPNVFAGYWHLPDKTRKVLDAGGWFHTGDRGELDRDGYLYLHGRGSAMIVLSGGENVDPERIEEVLVGADEIREAGVLEHDDRLAAVVVPETAVVRKQDGEALRTTMERAVGEATRALPSHHRPGHVRITLDPLPRTRLGKLRRHKLQALFTDLETSEAPEAAATPLSPDSMAPEDQQLLSDPSAASTWQYLARRFNDRRLTPDSLLAQDLDLDSLSWIELTLALRDRTGIDLDDAAIGRVETVRDLLREAAGAATGGEAGRTLPDELADPAGSLGPDQEAQLAPATLPRRAAGLALLGCARLIGRLVLRVEVSGSIPPGGPYLIAPRHLSAIDPLLLLRVLSRRRLESLYWAGWTGLLFAGRLSRWFSRIARVLPIDPGTAPRQSLILAAACLQRGASLIWFPEGRRSRDGRLQPFRPGIGLLLRAQPVPVIPIWLEGTRAVLPPGRVLPRPGRVRLVVGDPVTPEEYGQDERQIVELLQARVEALSPGPDSVR